MKTLIEMSVIARALPMRVTCRENSTHSSQMFWILLNIWNDSFEWLHQITSYNETPAHKSGAHVPFIGSNLLQIPMQNCLVFRLNVWELICGLRCNYSNHRHHTDESHWSQNWAGHSHWLTCSTFIDNWYLYIGIHKCRKRSFDLAHLHLYH